MVNFTVPKRDRRNDDAHERRTIRFNESGIGRCSDKKQEDMLRGEVRTNDPRSGQTDSEEQETVMDALGPKRVG